MQCESRLEIIYNTMQKCRGLGLFYFELGIMSNLSGSQTYQDTYTHQNFSFHLAIIKQEFPPASNVAIQEGQGGHITRRLHLKDVKLSKSFTEPVDTVL